VVDGVVAVVYRSLELAMSENVDVAFECLEIADNGVVVYRKVFWSLSEELKNHDRLLSVLRD
jgi:hypothetical protein